MFCSSSSSIVVVVVVVVTVKRLAVSVQLLQSASLGARPNAEKVMLLLTDAQVTDEYKSNYLRAIARLNTTDILRIGNNFSSLIKPVVD